MRSGQCGLPPRAGLRQDLTASTAGSVTAATAQARATPRQNQGDQGGTNIASPSINVYAATAPTTACEPTLSASRLEWELVHLHLDRISGRRHERRGSGVTVPAARTAPTTSNVALTRAVAPAAPDRSPGTTIKVTGRTCTQGRPSSWATRRLTSPTAVRLHVHHPEQGHV